MNDPVPIFERIAAINPVPDENDIPSSAMAATALLEVIDERTGTVQTQQTQTKPVEGPKRRRTGVVVALTAFAVVIVVGGAIAFTGVRSQDVSSSGSVEVISLDDVIDRLRSGSMLDTIQAGALLTVDRSAYDSDLPERLDIVLYAEVRVSDVSAPPELVARVIALPGETVEIRNGAMYVNNRILDEPYVRDRQIPVTAIGPITLGADELWAIGDNRQQSGDSRMRFPGTLPISWLRGEIVEIANP